MKGNQIFRKLGVASLSINNTGTASVLMPQYDGYEIILATSGLLLP